MNSNFRYHFVSLLLLVDVVVPFTATAQATISNAVSGSVEDRVTQMELTSNAHVQLLTQLQQQLSDTQRDIDSLRGQIQENQHQLRQVVERQKQIYQEIDILGSSSSTSSSTPVTDTSAVVISASAGDANSEYNAAASLVLEKKQYEQAIAAFQIFIKNYPDSTYQPNAKYWLGQLNYNKGKKKEAAHYFANVVKSYPTSPKSSEALFKIGVIMQEAGQTDKAKAVYQQVIQQYPNTESAKQAKKRLTRL
ncbi:MAG: tol-pal system protein YbgF [Candidatus Malihini olakiniferum]